MRIRTKVNAFRVISSALESAVVSGMNKTDKYLDVALTPSQRDLLLNQIDNYFWLNIEEGGIEFE